MSIHTYIHFIVPCCNVVQYISMETLYKQLCREWPLPTHNAHVHAHTCAYTQMPCTYLNLMIHSDLLISQGLKRGIPLLIGLVHNHPWFTALAWWAHIYFMYVMYFMYERQHVCTLLLKTLHKVWWSKQNKCTYDPYMYEHKWYAREIPSAYISYYYSWCSNWLE